MGRRVAWTGEKKKGSLSSVDQKTHISERAHGFNNHDNTVLPSRAFGAKCLRDVTGTRRDSPDVGLPFIALREMRLQHIG